jgi:hypothetical protein
MFKFVNVNSRQMVCREWLASEHEAVEARHRHTVCFDLPTDRPGDDLQNL